MPCDIDSLLAARCNNLSLQSPTIQRAVWRQFLCEIATALDPEYVCPTVPNSQLLCQSSAKLRLIQAQVLCESLNIDCPAFTCLSLLQQEALRTQLVCKITDALAAGPSPPVQDEHIFYFQLDGFEDFSGSPYLLNVAYPVADLSMSAGAANSLAIVAGKIDNAIHARSIWLTSAAATNTLAGAFDDALNFNNRSWTVRLWRRGIEAPSGGQFGSINHIAIDHVGTLESAILIRVGFEGAPANIYRLIATVTGTGATQVLFKDMDIGEWLNWTRMVVRYNAVTNILSVQGNDDAPATVAMPGGWFMPDKPLRLRYQPSTSGAAVNQYELDELYVHNGYAWTDADSTYDWNGGAGRTWPDVPQP